VTQGDALGWDKDAPLALIFANHYSAPTDSSVTRAGGLGWDKDAPLALIAPLII
jgi:hypothetical protein